MNIDMTKGNSLKLILKFVVPVWLGLVFQQLYGMVDTIIVGRFVGETALAAVGATGTISFFILGFATGLTTGFTVLTAHRFGAGDAAGVQKSIGNAFLLTLIVTVIMTVFSVAIMDPLLHLMQTPDDMFEMSRTYILIICWGIAGILLYNLSASILRALGNSRVPLYFLILSAGLNIALDLLFIAVFCWGVAGAAFATILSQGISGVICTWFLLTRTEGIHLKKTDFLPEGQGIENQLKIGLPMALQFSITAIGTMVLQAALNLFGSSVVAAFTAACKIEYIVTSFFEAMGTAMATFSAQNWGIHDIARIRRGEKEALAVSSLYAVVIFGVTMLVLPAASSLFFAGDISEVYPYIRLYFQIGGVCFIPLGMIFIYRNMLQGCDMPLMPTLGGVVELVARTVFSLIAAKTMNYAGICVANASAWLSAGIFLWIAYLVICKGKLRLEKK